jgi:chromosome segregation ATPase
MSFEGEKIEIKQSEEGEEEKGQDLNKEITREELELEPEKTEKEIQKENLEGELKKLQDKLEEINQEIQAQKNILEEQNKRREKLHETTVRTSTEYERKEQPLPVELSDAISQKVEDICVNIDEASEQISNLNNQKLNLEVGIEQLKEEIRRVGKELEKESKGRNFNKEIEKI